MSHSEYDRTNVLVGAAMVAATLLLGVLHYCTKPTAAEQAERARIREARAQTIAKNCDAAKAAQQTLVAQGNSVAAKAVDLEQACEPDKVAARPFLYGLGAYFIGGGLLVALLLALVGRAPLSLG